MAQDNLSLQIPSISDFSVSYYTNSQSDVYNARVFPPHVDDALEIYVLLEGDASFMVDDNLYKLKSGDAVITRPNQMHNCILNSNSVHSHLCFWFKPDCEFVFNKLLNPLNTNHVTPSGENKERLTALYADIIKSSEDKDDIRTLYLMLEMIDVFGKEIGATEHHSTMSPLLKNIVDDITENLIEINSLSYFTKKYCISSSTLNRLFKDNFNTSPKLYIETKRLSLARVLLKSGESVMSACMKAGFPDYSNFIRLFRRRFGLTPNQYKKKK
ncbi:MAG: AraC family transcriptional regulator [Clostridia bacterium]|nr:AraC family transcriptional regulator [Clostridia bacterium]